MSLGGLGDSKKVQHHVIHHTSVLITSITCRKNKEDDDE